MQLNYLFRCPSKQVIVAFLFGIMLCFAYSCNNDDEPNGQDEFIVVGDYRGMTVDSTVKVIEAQYNGGSTIPFDTDADDTAELRLVVAMPGSPGMGMHYISQLESLTADCQLSGYLVSDTVYRRQVHSIFSDDYNNHYHTITSYYNCYRTSPADKILSVSTGFHVRNLEKGDQLPVTGVFAADTVSFINGWTGPDIWNVVNDTVYVSKEYYSFQCHQVPTGRDIYLGFRVGNENPRLGWIKLLLQSSNKITLKEFAIQRR